MPKLDGTGPEKHSDETGRKLGKCIILSDEEKLKKLGKGMGRKRKSVGESGKGKRLKSNNN